MATVSAPAKREKRSVRITSNLRPSVAKAVLELATHDGRPVSTVIQRVLEKDPSVRIFIERIELREGRS
jgi:hypothetical protein